MKEKETTEHLRMMTLKTEMKIDIIRTSATLKITSIKKVGADQVLMMMMDEEEIDIENRQSSIPSATCPHVSIN